MVDFLEEERRILSDFLFELAILSEGGRGDWRVERSLMR